MQSNSATIGAGKKNSIHVLLSKMLCYLDASMYNLENAFR
jgi:hypothetical protein